MKVALNIGKPCLLQALELFKKPSIRPAMEIMNCFPTLKQAYT